MAAPSGRLPTPHGTLRKGKMAELRISSGILGIPGSAFCFLTSPPLLRRFRVCIISALAVGVKRGASLNPTEHHGALRIGKMAELRIESIILRVPVSAFVFSDPTPLLRRFRVFSIAALGVVGQWPPPRYFSRNFPRNLKERRETVKWRNCD